jgi:hypothetical protein
VHRGDALDRLTVKVEIYPKMFLGDPAQLEALKLSTQARKVAWEKQQEKKRKKEEKDEQGSEDS